MTHNNIIDILREQSALNKPQGVANIKQTLTLISNSFSLKELISSLTSDEQYLATMASLSYSHSLGFDKIIIAPYENSNYQLRFNIWWSEYTMLANHYEHIHNHRWDFSTYLLLGSYRFENYRPAKAGLSMHHYFYYEFEKGKYQFDDQGIKEIELFETGILNRREQMSVSNDILHKVVPVQTNVPTVSLFLTSKPRVNKTSIYSETEILNKISVNKTLPMTANELRNKLLLLLSIE
ncbi:MAG: hypothetical protein V4722_03210 [Bacteroidota bacterium]